MITRKGKLPYLHMSVEHNGLIYLAGVTAETKSGGIKSQTVQILRQIDALLETHQSSKAKILSATIFITDFSLKSEMNEVWIDWLDGADMPARATTGISDLGPDVLIEIAAIAAK